MDKNNLWRLSASEIVKATTAGEIRSIDVITSVIGRMRKVNPKLNAVVIDLSEKALKAAELLDGDRANGKECGPLHGVPITIKINVDQKGQSTSNGVSALKNLIAPDDAPIVKNLKKAGAIIIGRTNTPEFSFRADTDNELHGRTNNPWGDHVSAGGSSGGAGAAVMSGIGAMGHGNDIGGSLRFPAAANGAFTVKPGLGRVPAWNPSQNAERGILAQSMSVQGLLTRDPLDLDLAMPILFTNDPVDPFHVPLPYDMGTESQKCKIALARETPGFETNPEIYKGLELAAEALRDAGHEVVEIDPPFLLETATSGYRALMGEVIELMGPDIRKIGSSEINRIFDEYFKQFKPYTGTDLLKILAKRSYYAREWSVFLTKYPLILSPFLPQPFFKPGRDLEGQEGVREVLGSALWSYSINFLGLPAGCFPTHLAQLKQGTQAINVQLIGQRWREDLIVQGMKAIRNRLGTFSNELWSIMEKNNE